MTQRQRCPDFSFQNLNPIQIRSLNPKPNPNPKFCQQKIIQNQEINNDNICVEFGSFFYHFGLFYALYCDWL